LAREVSSGWQLQILSASLKQAFPHPARSGAARAQATRSSRLRRGMAGAI
jgi:hypothetical protein